MKSFPRTLALAALALGLLPALASAQPVEVRVVNSIGPTQMLITPAGNGDELAAIGKTITVEVRNLFTGQLVAGYAAQDLFFTPKPGVNFCVQGNIADDSTGPFGRTTFSGAFEGGGWQQTGVSIFPSDGLPSDLLPISTNSPDINGDLVVNTSDLGIFAADFGSGTYHFRSDFVPDGVLNISDVGEFASHVGEVCP